MQIMLFVFAPVFLLGWTNVNSAELDFALSLLSKLPANESCIMSPLSISLAMALVHSGTKGTARTEIEQVILDGTANKKFSQHFSNLIKNISNSSDVELQLANRVYVRKDYTLLDSYKSSVQENYNASAISLDFKDRIGSADAVNSFVNQTTHGKIAEIVTSKMFKDALILLLVNAIYMKAEWAHKFNTRKIKFEKFYTNETSEKEINYLTQSFVYRDYYENDQYQLLSLKYTDQRYRFNVFLPKNKFQLETILADITGKDIEEVLNSCLYRQRIDIKLPKFKLESNLELPQTLMDLGIKKVFDGGEDLSGFSGSDQLKISDVIHKATIEISEQGTIAAGVTRVGVFATSALNSKPPKLVYFHADHPFMFCITFDSHPVFIGKYY